MCIFLMPGPHATLTGLAGRHVHVALKLRGKIRVNLFGGATRYRAECHTVS